MPSTLSFWDGELLSTPGDWTSLWWLPTTRTSLPTPASTGWDSSTAPRAGTPGSYTTGPPSTYALRGRRSGTLPTRASSGCTCGHRVLMPGAFTPTSSRRIGGGDHTTGLPLYCPWVL